MEMKPTQRPWSARRCSCELIDRTNSLCPGDEWPEGDGFATSYAGWTRGVLEPNPPEGATERLPILWDDSPDHHGDVRCVLFADGTVEPLAEPELQRLWSTWEGRGFER
ncbi:MAG: hypothetical protein HY720_31735 [Planctomycetes bacterium]|nr:hypothetical protein [Planctomycetota bacterium]